MKYRFTLFILFSLFLFQTSGWSQSSSCEYILELRDGFGDGWNGASIQLSLNGEITVYDLDNQTDNGLLERIILDVNTGDQVSITYNRGLYDEEVSWFFIDPEGEILIEFNGNPQVGEVFNQTLNCPTCIGPQINEIILEDVRASTADITWSTINQQSGQFVVEVGLGGFTPGTGTSMSTTNTDVRLSNLEENTSYDLYLNVRCDNGDESKVIGPVSFTTRWAKDTRIQAILNPITSCDLGFNDTVRVNIQNLGGDPQTLIPFKYDVNDLGLNISMPTDGLYTGVLGKDSIGLAEFDLTFNFANPGEYTIKSWTELDGDSFPENDTLELTIISIPEVDVYPYSEAFENWSGGWTIASESRSSSWSRGQPSGAVINQPAAGSNSWVTNLSGNYNSGETSYLVSPCLDFTSFSEDPQISFSLFVDTEENLDGAWLEMSIDDGETWTKLLASDDAINWYNNTNTQVWDGNGGFEGWAFASNILSGTAGLERVRVRFAFSSDFSISKEGIGVDNILVNELFTNDLASVSVASASEEACGATDDNVILTISNLGSSPISSFEVNYRIGDGDVVTENVSGTIISGGQLIYTFNTPFNSFEQETLNITAWVNFPGGDQFAGNDTVKISLSTLKQLPFGEDFEGQRIPDRWISDGVVTDGHSSRSFVLSGNLSGSNTSFTSVTPLIGPVAATDSLSFEYRIVSQAGNGNIGEELNAGDQLIVEVSTDCGQNYENLLIINASNHETSALFATRVIYLDAYEGETLRFRFRATRGAGNYWVDLDNINIARCPPSLDLSFAIGDEVGINSGNGSASVDPGAGEGPFNYLWSNGDDNKRASRLSAGVYTVTVTDRFGCTDTGEVLVGLFVDADETPIEIDELVFSPNPTKGIVNMNLELKENQDVSLQLVNMMGQILWQRQDKNIKTLNYPIDLSAFPDGMYFVRVKTGKQFISRKLIKSR